MLGSSPLGISASCWAHPCSGSQHLSRHPDCLTILSLADGLTPKAQVSNLSSRPFQRPLIKLLFSHLQISRGCDRTESYTLTWDCQPCLGYSQKACLPRQDIDVTEHTQSEWEAQGADCLCLGVNYLPGKAQCLCNMSPSVQHVAKFSAQFTPHLAQTRPATRA